MLVRQFKRFRLSTSNSLSKSNIQSKSNFSIFSQKNYKVAILGGAGGIGQALALLLKLNTRVTNLSLYDIVKATPGVSKDLSHINTVVPCTGYTGEAKLAKCLEGAHIVVIPAGFPRSPGMTQVEVFHKNCSIVHNLTCAIAQVCPCALICIITNPVNSMVPLASEVMMMSGVYDGAKIFGVTTLDVVRAATFVSRYNGSDPACQYVPVVGGHTGPAIVPLLSQSVPPACLSDEQIDLITRKVQSAGADVIKAKQGDGSATLSMAFAAARFTDALMRGLSGEPNIVECAYVASGLTKATYFATPLRLGCQGMDISLGIGEVTSYEQKLIDKSVEVLQKYIKLGTDYVRKGANQAQEK